MVVQNEALISGLKSEKPIWYGILGGIILVFYGIVATWQTSNFARVYATYGGFFIVMSLIEAEYLPSENNLISFPSFNK